MHWAPVDLESDLEIFPKVSCDIINGKPMYMVSYQHKAETICPYCTVFKLCWRLDLEMKSNGTWLEVSPKVKCKITSGKSTNGFLSAYNTDNVSLMHPSQVTGHSKFLTPSLIMKYNDQRKAQCGFLTAPNTTHILHHCEDMRYF